MLLDFKLDIDPKPVMLSETLDVEGDTLAVAWFDQLASSLTITSRFEAETLRTNAFDYLFFNVAYARLPLQYSQSLEPRLLAYRVAEQADLDAVDGLVAAVMDETGPDTIAFLSSLNQRIHDSLEVIVRHEGPPWRPAETLERGEGACRDLAMLFVACCRKVGVAARFVSGYQAGERPEEARYLHAWAEVYMPGGGWRGYDPTHALAVANSHVAISTGASPSEAAPIIGAFRGDDVTAKMTAELRVRTN